MMDPLGAFCLSTDERRRANLAALKLYLISFTIAAQEGRGPTSDLCASGNT